MQVDWQTASFDELNKRDLFEILKLRQAVFVVEQECPYPDIDEIDTQCLHLSGFVNGKLAAYLRMMQPGLSHEYASIGRVLVAPEFRGTGIGRALMQESLRIMENRYPNHPIKIGAQQHLEQFYQNLGFTTLSEVYLEDGIPHIDMLRT